MVRPSKSKPTVHVYSDGDLYATKGMLYRVTRTQGGDVNLKMLENIFTLVSKE